MRKFAVLALALMLAVACLPVLAVPSAYDEFVYAPTTQLHTLSGGVGWATSWNVYIDPPSFLITNGGLTFPGLVTTGNAVQNTQPVGGSFNAAVRNTIGSYGGNGVNTWFQYLVRPDNVTAQFGGLVINGSFFSPQSVQFGLLPSQNRLYIQQGFGGTPVTAPWTIVQGQTYLVQGHLQISGTGSATMSAYLWRDNAGTPQLVASILNTPLAGSWSGAMNSVELYSSGQMTYDQFFINDRPNDPVPEAGTMVALGSFLSMGGLFLRRRFAKS